MPSVPSEFTVTCDICDETTSSPTPVPDGWQQVAGPQRLANNPMAVQPAFLCPAHVTAYGAFWAKRAAGTTITIA